MSYPPGSDLARGYAEGFIAGGQWPQRPVLCIGMETLRQIADGACRLDEVDLVPADDFPRDLVAALTSERARAERLAAVARADAVEAVEAVAQAIEDADDLTLNPNPRGPIRELRARAAIRETLAHLRTVTPEMVEAWYQTWEGDKDFALGSATAAATADWLAMLDAWAKERVGE